MNFPNNLSQNSSIIDETLTTISNFDRCFVTGFANLNNQLYQALASLERIFTGTPLHESLKLALTAIEQNEFSLQHFIVLAAARTALQGALFDSLEQQAFLALGRTKALEAKEAEGKINQISAGNLAERESIQHWLMEIALIGFARLDATALLPFTATLEQVQANSKAIDIAALLTGFYNELIAIVPIKDIDTIPTYRWVDLWSRGMVGKSNLVESDTAINISGTLELLGLDLRHHANLVSFTLYGLLTSLDETRAVRVTMSAYKVDAITGDEIWLLFPEADLLLDSFCTNKALSIRDMPMLSTGDLLWDSSKAEVGTAFKLMSKAKEFYAINAAENVLPCQVHPLDRHPIQLAEPIFLEDYRVKKNGDELLLNWSEGTLKIASKRNSVFSGLTERAIASSKKMFGLLRYDAGSWEVQPLVVESKKINFAGQNAPTILQKPPKKSTVAILQERASRLLRKS